jgi:hypothetical protein
VVVVVTLLPVYPAPHAAVDVVALVAGQSIATHPLVSSLDEVVGVQAGAAP